MTTALTPEQSFQDKIKDRLREQIGDLIPDELLSKMVHTAMQEAFFKERVIPQSYGPDKVEPSWFKTEIKSQLQGKVVEFLKEHIAAHSAEIEKIIADTIRDEIPKMLAAGLVRMITDGAGEVGQQVHFAIAERLNR